MSSASNIGQTVAPRADTVSRRGVGAGGRLRRYSQRAVAAASCALLISACGADQSEAVPGSDSGSSETERQEFAFGGTVQTIDTVTSIVAVANDAIPGWMMAMTMNYYVHPPEVIESLEPGDRIIAKVYSGDFQNIYEVEVVDPPQ